MRHRTIARREVRPRAACERAMRRRTIASTRRGEEQVHELPHEACRRRGGAGRRAARNAGAGHHQRPAGRQRASVHRADAGDEQRRRPDLGVQRIAAVADAVPDRRPLRRRARRPRRGVGRHRPDPARHRLPPGAVHRPDVLGVVQRVGGLRRLSLPRRRRRCAASASGLLRGLRPGAAARGLPGRRRGHARSPGPREPRRPLRAAGDRRPGRHAGQQGAGGPRGLRRQRPGRHPGQVLPPAAAVLPLGRRRPAPLRPERAGVGRLRPQRRVHAVLRPRAGAHASATHADRTCSAVRTRSWRSTPTSRTPTAPGSCTPSASTSHRCATGSSASCARDRQAPAQTGAPA